MFVALSLRALPPNAPAPPCKSFARSFALTRAFVVAVEQARDRSPMREALIGFSATALMRKAPNARWTTTGKSARLLSISMGEPVQKQVDEQATRAPVWRRMVQTPANARPS
jgi:hypothetical protein